MERVRKKYLLELDHVSGGEVVVLVEDVAGVEIRQRSAPPHGVVIREILLREEIHVLEWHRIRKRTS